MTDMETPPASIGWSRKVVLVSYSCLLFAFLVNGLIRIETGTLPALLFLWLLRSIPLLIFLPGLLGGRLRTHAWLSFVVLLYFTQAVLTAFSDVDRVFGLVETGFCVVLFTALVVYIRSYRNHYKVSL